MSLRASNFEQIFALIADATTILIASHRHSDGDSLGSSRGFGETLKKMNKKITYYTPVSPSQKFSLFDPYDQMITDISKLDVYSFDYIIVLDTGGRQSQLTPLFDAVSGSLPTNSLTIDHHATNSIATSNKFVSTQYSSTCEIITHLLDTVYPQYIDHDIATYLLLGILTDTGNLRRGMKKGTLERVAKLEKYGARREEIMKQFFMSHTFDEIFFLGDVLQRMRTYKTVLSIMYDTKELEGKNIDTESIGYLVKDTMKVITEYPVKILLSVHNNFIRTSLRSDEIDVARLAKDLFDGGGHVRAAGARIPKDTLLTLPEQEKDIMNKIADATEQSEKYFIT